MTISRLEWAKELRAAGRVIGRDGMSERVIAAVGEFDGSYKGAMILAGRLKAITQMAACDGYWTEQVEKGFHRERNIAPVKPAVAA